MSGAVRLRWIRILAIAASAVVLASCRSLTTLPVLVIATSAPHSEESPAEESRAEESRADDSRVDSLVVPAGLEAPCPPLPRLQRRGAPAHCRGAPAHYGGAPAHCRSACAVSGCRTGACESGNCPMPVCPPPPVVPMVGPYFVCDGGDHLAPAKPTGHFGIENLTAGDTVARYRAADSLTPETGAEASAEACLAIANCACVYAPRFSSVREITRPHEDAAPVGPRGLSLDAITDAAIENLPVLARTQRLCPERARKAELGIAVEERLPPLAVDQNEPPTESLNVENPVERVRDEQPLHADLVQTPRIKVGFDVPFAWTCVKSAQVTVNGQTAEVIAADRGTATLRLEEPGRCELTLCKQAGSDTARVGEELDFTIFLLNSGDRALTDIVLVDAVPKRLTVIPQSPASSLPADISTAAGDDGSVVLTWRLEGTLRPGESGFVRFRTLVR